jgi:hypothetical protein
MSLDVQGKTAEKTGGGRPVIARKPPPDGKSRNGQPHVMGASKQRTHEHYRDPELGRKTLKARSKLYELIVQFRMDASTASDPKAQVLFEFSAEILAGMARSFREFDESRNDPPVGM